MENVSNRKTTFIKCEKLHDQAFVTYIYTVYRCSMREPWAPQRNSCACSNSILIRLVAALRQTAFCPSTSPDHTPYI